MRVPVLSAVLVAVLSVAVARVLAVHFGLADGTPDWRIVGAMIGATLVVYGIIRA